MTGNVTERQCTCVTPLLPTYSITYAQFTYIIIVMNILLSNATIIQQNMVDSECTSMKDSSYLPKEIHVEKEQYQLF